MPMNYRFCGTKQGTDQELMRILGLLAETHRVKYIALARTLINNQEMIWGYITFCYSTRLGQVRKLFPDYIITPIHGTLLSNRDYLTYNTKLFKQGW